MATKEKVKSKNRSYLRRVFRLKMLFYPVLRLFHATGIPVFIEKTINRVILFFGVNKNVHYFFKYRDYGKWFSNGFRDNKGNRGDIVFPMMAGANGNFTMLNLMFASYFREKDELNPVFYVCDEALGICTKDGMLRSREKYPWFCFECWKGYDYISDKTGIEIRKMKSYPGYDADQQKNEIENIDSLSELKQCYDYTYKDIEAGRLARKSVLRYFLVGALPDTPEVIRIYKEYLKSAVTYASAFEQFIDSRAAIRAVIIYNGTLVFDSIVIHYCEKRGIPYITYETFLGNNSLIYKKNGEVMNLDWGKEYALFSAAKRFPSDAETIVESFFSGLKRGDQMYAVLNREHSDDRLKDAGSYVCLFTNLNFDTAVLDKNTYFSDMEDWIYSVVDYWKEHNPQKKLVIRIHPGEMKLVTATKEFLGERIKKAVGDCQNIIVFDSTDKVNSYELIMGMDFSLIYSSTIGLETAWAGKPCVVAGLPWYINRSFVIAPDSRVEYFNTIDKLNDKSLAFVPDRNELVRSVYFNYFHRTRRFNGIKLHTPREEPNCQFNDAKEMIAANISIFNELRDELYDPGI